jgi:hypothetical protein
MEVDMNVTPIPEPNTEDSVRRPEGAWAQPVKTLDASQIKAGINLNVDGKELASPMRGFGQLWQKTYTIRLEGTDIQPEEVIRVWKGNFGSFWAKNNHFYGSPNAIAAGDVAVVNLAGPYGLTGPGGKGLVSTGVLVIYADDVSFSFMTPDGHMFAGMIIFSSEIEDGATMVQVQALVRASDPLYEMGARLGTVHKMEDEHWHYVLTQLAAHFGRQAGVVQKNMLVDPRIQWGKAGNIRHNAAIRTGIYLALSPLRWAAGLVRGKA